MRRDDERALLALTHSLQTLFPTFDDLTPTHFRISQHTSTMLGLLKLTRNGEGRVAVVTSSRHVVFASLFTSSMPCVSPRVKLVPVREELPSLSQG